MGPFCSKVYGASYHVMIRGRMYVGGRAVGLQSSGEPDQAPRRARRKQRRRQGQGRRANSGGCRVDGRTTEAGGFGR